MKFSIRNSSVGDTQQQQNNEDMLAGVNTLAQFVFTGTGAPTFTPDGPAIYFRQDFGSNTAVYVYDGTWKSVT